MAFSCLLHWQVRQGECCAEVCAVLMQRCRAHPEGGSGLDVGRGSRGHHHPLRHWGFHRLPSTVQPQPGPYQGFQTLGQEQRWLCHGRGCRCVSVTFRMSIGWVCHGRGCASVTFMHDCDSNCGVLKEQQFTMHLMLFRSSKDAAHCQGRCHRSFLLYHTHRYIL